MNADNGKRTRRLVFGTSGFNRAPHWEAQANSRRGVSYRILIRGDGLFQLDMVDELKRLLPAGNAVHICFETLQEAQLYLECLEETMKSDDAANPRQGDETALEQLTRVMRIRKAFAEMWGSTKCPGMYRFPPAHEDPVAKQSIEGVVAAIMQRRMHFRSMGMSEESIREVEKAEMIERNMKANETNPGAYMVLNDNLPTPQTYFTKGIFHAAEVPMSPEHAADFSPVGIPDSDRDSDPGDSLLDSI